MGWGGGGGCGGGGGGTALLEGFVIRVVLGLGEGAGIYGKISHRRSIEPINGEVEVQVLYRLYAHVVKVRHVIRYQLD